MHIVPITVNCIAQTRMNQDQVRAWLDSVGAETYTVDPDQSVTDAEACSGLAAKRCYKSFVPGLNPNVQRVRDDWNQYIDNLLKVGHGSVLEHATWTFAIEGVSRVFTAELNRHRAGVAISEGSMRYIRFDDIGYWEPRSVQPGGTVLDGLAQVFGQDGLEARKARTREILAKAFAQTEALYSELVELWGMDTIDAFHEKKLLTSVFRRIVGMGVATGGVWTFNGRALRHVLNMRCSSAAEEEICHVFTRVAALMCKAEPRIFADFKEDKDGFIRPVYAKV